MKRIGFLSFVFCLSLTMNAQTKVIAHRGYWNIEGSAQNSIDALKKAYEYGFHGSEFDVHQTKDGVLVVNHDRTIQGVDIQDSKYKELKHLKLKNGEALPTLKEYLKAGKKLKGLRLVLEIKSHKTRQREDKCVDAVVKMVKRLHLQDQVDYIAFSRHVCERLVEKSPDSEITYLEGDLAPQEVKRLGFDGIDYEQGVLRKHPEWIQECHDLGLSVNVWTVNKEESIRYFVEQGVDYITTNEPELLQKLLK